MKSIIWLFNSLSITFLIGFINLAWGHAHPVTYDPQPDAVVQMQKSVSIIFDDEIEPILSSLTITDDNKQKIVAGSVDKSNPKKMIVQLPSLAVGTYHVNWIAVAMDGHKTHGGYDFKVK